MADSAAKPKTSATVPDPDEPVSIRIPVSESKVESVTVYQDRAEVIRSVIVTPEQLGPHEISIERFQSSIIGNTVRVNGDGDIVIIDVAYGTNQRIAPTEATEPILERPVAEEGELEGLRAQIKQLKVEDDLAALQKSRMGTERNHWNNYIADLIAGRFASDDSPRKRGGLQEAPLDVVSQALQFQTTRLAELDSELNSLAAAAEERAKQRASLQQQLTDLSPTSFVRVSPTSRYASNDVTVNVAVNQLAPFTLRVVYLVTGASWQPSYNIRISSSDNSLALTYFAQIKQSTGEDWARTRLILSTASPAIGGSPPPLPRKAVRFYQPPMPVYHSFGMAMAASAPASRSYSLECDEESDEDECLMECKESAPSPPPAARISTAVVQSGGGSSGAGNATFLIPRPATITCDNKPKKVTIAILNLESVFVHYCVPALSPHAFLKSTTTNNSDFPLLASSDVSIFFDNAFVSSSALKAVSPGEKFSSFLGVDPAVRIDHKPERKASKQVGFFSKSNTMQTTQVTIVKNSKRVPLLLCMQQQLPLSTDDKINVVLEQPSEAQLLSSSEQRTAAEERGDNVEILPGVRIERDSNHVEWVLELEAQAEQEVVLDYRLEWPADKQIEMH